MTEPTPPAAAPAPSYRSTSFLVAILTALSTVLTTLIPGLSSPERITLFLVVGGVGAIWIVCSVLLKRGTLRAGQPSAGAGLAAIAPHLPALAGAVLALASLAKGPLADPAAVPPLAPPPDPTRPQPRAVPPAPPDPPAGG